MFHSLLLPFPCLNLGTISRHSSFQAGKYRKYREVDAVNSRQQQQNRSYKFLRFLNHTNNFRTNLLKNSVNSETPTPSFATPTKRHTSACTYWSFGSNIRFFDFTGGRKYQQTFILDAIFFEEWVHLSANFVTKK